MSTNAAQQPAAPLPPQNLDAEESVLGAIMLSPHALTACQPILGDGRDFYRESHTLIWRAALDLHDRGEPVDAVTVANELHARRQLDRVGGKERIQELASLVPSTLNAPHYAEIVHEMAVLRAFTLVGEQIQRLGWERPLETAEAVQRAQELVNGIASRAVGRARLPAETWHEFESQAHDHVPTLVDQLWPEAAFGFVAAPPKKGKTWVALALSVAVATGRSFLGRYAVPKPRNVLYVALEGHRAGLRARVGAIARGMRIDPDGDDLHRLHWLYKPAGLNLADPAWARAVHDTASHLRAALIVVDVLRAAATIKENDQEQFVALRRNLQPITDDGISLCVLHHFGKLTELQRDRAPGERMSGTGAMFGALDAAIYITGSDDGARKLRLEFDTRDLASPEHVNAVLEGDGSGPNGGYTYTDAAAFTIVDEEIGEDELKAPAAEIRAFVIAEGGVVEAKYVRAHFEISDHTLTRRLGRLRELGVEYVAKPGKPGRLVTSEVPPKPNTPEVRTSEVIPLNHAGLREPPNTSEVEALRTQKTADLQGFSTSEPPNSPTESARTRARARDASPAPPTNGEARDHELDLDDDAGAPGPWDDDRDAPGPADGARP